MEPADVVRGALAPLGNRPPPRPAAADRKAEAMFRSMSRGEVIELMSGITGQLVPAGAVGTSVLTVTAADIGRMRDQLFFEGPERNRRLSRFWVLLVLAGVISRRRV